MQFNLSSLHRRLGRITDETLQPRKNWKQKPLSMTHIICLRQMFCYICAHMSVSARASSINYVQKAPNLSFLPVDQRIAALVVICTCCEKLLLYLICCTGNQKVSKGRNVDEHEYVAITLSLH